MKNCEELVAGDLSCHLLIVFAARKTYQTNDIFNKIGACFYVDEFGVSQGSRRISDKLKKDKKLRKNSYI